MIFYRIRDNHQGDSRDSGTPVRAQREQKMGVRIDNAEDRQKVQRHRQTTRGGSAREKYQGKLLYIAIVQ